VSWATSAGSCSRRSRSRRNGGGALLQRLIVKLFQGKAGVFCAGNRRAASGTAISPGCNTGIRIVGAPKGFGTGRLGLVIAVVLEEFGACSTSCHDNASVRKRHATEPQQGFVSCRRWYLSALKGIRRELPRPKTLFDHHLFRCNGPALDERVAPKDLLDAAGVEAAARALRVMAGIGSWIETTSLVLKLKAVSHSFFCLGGHSRFHPA